MKKTLIVQFILSIFVLFSCSRFNEFLNNSPEDKNENNTQDSNTGGSDDQSLDDLALESSAQEEFTPGIGTTLAIHGAIMVIPANTFDKQHKVTLNLLTEEELVANMMDANINLSYENGAELIKATEVILGSEGEEIKLTDSLTITFDLSYLDLKAIPASAIPSAIPTSALPSAIPAYLFKDTIKYADDSNLQLKVFSAFLSSGRKKIGNPISFNPKSNAEKDELIAEITPSMINNQTLPGGVIIEIALFAIPEGANVNVDEKEIDDLEETIVIIEEEIVPENEEEVVVSSAEEAQGQDYEKKKTEPEEVKQGEGIAETKFECSNPESDSDQDGLRDCVETNTGIWKNMNNTGTNPNKSDTDKDGYNDFQEVYGFKSNFLWYENKLNSGGGNNDVILHDFNNDSLVDIVFLNSMDHKVGIRLGNEDGTFNEEVFNSIGSDPVSMEVGDFNNDGNSDVAVAIYNAFSIILGNGDGTFSAYKSYSMGSSVHDIATGDINKDGNIDIIVTNNYSDNVSIRLGNGDGTFGNETTISVPDAPNSLNLKDINKDGNLDFLVLSTGINATLSVALGNGNGTFQSLKNYSFNIYCTTASYLADINNDNNLDIVAASSKLCVSLGSGDGSFQTSEIYELSRGISNANSLQVVDTNNDGNKDIITANGYGVEVRLGNENGIFEEPTKYYLQNSYSLHTYDIDGDNDIDIATSDLNNICISFGNGDGTFGSETQDVYSMGEYPYSIEIADINNDKINDSLAISGNDNATIVRLGLGDSSFSNFTEYPVENCPQDIELSDINNDEILDIIVTYQCGYGGISTRLGNGDGSFGAVTTYEMTQFAGSLTGYSNSLSVEDINNDGNKDIITLNYERCFPMPQPDTYSMTLECHGTNGITVRLGKGDGSFGEKTGYKLNNSPAFIKLCDLNNDKYLDIITRGGYGLSINLGNSDGSLQEEYIYSLDYYPSSIECNDVNHDNYEDIIISAVLTKKILRDFQPGFPDSYDYQYFNKLYVLFGNGDKTFKEEVTYDAQFASQNLQLYDINGDDNLDAINYDYYHGFTLRLGNFDGTFGNEIAFYVGYVRDFKFTKTNSNILLYILNNDGFYLYKTAFSNPNMYDSDSDGNSDFIDNYPMDYEKH